MNKTTDAANCSFDECTCEDTNTMTANTWRCVCPPPLDNQTAPMTPAHCCPPSGCPFDECDDVPANAKVCNDAPGNQTCFDNDHLTNNTWECLCKPPATGPPGCDDHGATCTAKGQTCNDTNPSATSLNDWECSCPPPSTGKRVAGAAVCILDECVKDVCKGLGQVCTDPNPTPLSSGSLSGQGDWRCDCPTVDPVTGNKTFQVGSATGKPAVCIVNECDKPEAQCKANQKCDDWQCVCLDPFTGSFNGCTATDPAGKAACTLGTRGPCDFDECKDHAGTCTAANQTCNDTNLQKDGTWVCECVPPSVPDPSVAGNGVVSTAKCILNECVIDCDTCNKNTCEDGKATAKAAVCTRDECEDHEADCLTGCRPQTLDCKQKCVDPSMNDPITNPPNPAHTGDWRCVCEHSDEQACDMDSNGCTWSTTTKSCKPAPCTGDEQQCG
eukprot:gene52029-55548_t